MRHRLPFLAACLVLCILHVSDWTGAAVPHAPGVVVADAAGAVGGGPVVEDAPEGSSTPWSPPVEIVRVVETVQPMLVSDGRAVGSPPGQSPRSSIGEPAAPTHTLTDTRTGRVLERQAVSTWELGASPGL